MAQRDHVLRSEAGLIFFALMFVAGAGLLAYSVGFHVQNWHFALGACARAEADTGVIRLYAGQVAEAPGRGAVWETQPGSSWTMESWHTSSLIFVTDDRGARFAVRLAPKLPVGTHVVFCGKYRGTAAWWPEVGIRHGPVNLLDTRAVWGEPEGSYDRVRWITGTVLY